LIIRSGVLNGGRFTDDAFNIMFYGNASFAGKTADLSRTKFYLYSYSRIGFAAQQKISGIKTSLGEAGSKNFIAYPPQCYEFEFARMPPSSLKQNGEYIDAKL
jgi:hypothetical protein